MKDTTLFSWDNGSFIMIGVFSLVIIGLVCRSFDYAEFRQKNKKIAQKKRLPNGQPLAIIEIIRI